MDTINYIPRNEMSGETLTRFRVMYANGGQTDVFAHTIEEVYGVCCATSPEMRIEGRNSPEVTEVLDLDNNLVYSHFSLVYKTEITQDYAQISPDDRGGDSRRLTPSN